MSCSSDVREAEAAVSSAVGPEVSFRQISASETRVCGSAVLSQDESTRFIYDLEKKKLVMDPGIPTSTELDMAHGQCLDAVVTSFSTLNVGPGCDGIQTIADRYNAAADFLQKFNRECPKPS